MSTASLSLPHSLSTCARVIGISPGSFISFTGNPGFTLSAFVCYSLKIFRYSSLLFVIPLGLVAEACLQTVPPRRDRGEERMGYRNEPQTVQGLSALNTRVSAAPQMLWISLPLCVFIKQQEMLFAMQAEEMICVYVYVCVHATRCTLYFSIDAVFAQQYKQGINVVLVSWRGYRARLPQMKREGLCY